MDVNSRLAVPFRTLADFFLLFANIVAIGARAAYVLLTACSDLRGAGV